MAHDHYNPTLPCHPIVPLPFFTLPQPISSPLHGQSTHFTPLFVKWVTCYSSPISVHDKYSYTGVAYNSCEHNHHQLIDYNIFLLHPSIYVYLNTCCDKCDICVKGPFGCWELNKRVLIVDEHTCNKCSKSCFFCKEVWI
jgi:hypothetical protein